jgi:selenocysteine-specific elongation factor
MTYTIVGITGHIDHGKTTLVRVLTGVDTDTHPEEKRRGITIDLGFASFEQEGHRFALIDAPGHQKYIGNLLAGVSAIDIGLIVVAADQGIQEQTLEHAAVVRALGVSKLIVAISRIDLVNEAVVTELSEELELFLGDMGFDEVPTVAICAPTGSGMDRLRSLLIECANQDAAQDARPADTQPFRMPVDRVFTVPGRGLVVAGTIWTGQIRVGDMLQLAGTEHPWRVREIEVHGEMAESSQAGFRTAVNLVGSGNGELSRGDELIARGTHDLSDVLVVELNMFADTPAIRCPAMVQLHTGTNSCTARIVGVKQLEPAASRIVLVQPERPLVASYQQACLFRRPYPIGSFAGGRVLAATQRGSAKTKNLLVLGERLRSADACQRLLAWIDYLGEMELDATWCALHLGIAPESFAEVVDQAVQNESVLRIGGTLVSRSTLNRTRQFIRKMVEARAQQAEDVWLVEASIIERARGLGSPAMIQMAIEQMIGDKQLVRLNSMLALATDDTNLSKKQRSVMEQIVRIYSETRSPPTFKELTQQLELSSDALVSLVRFATQQKILTDLGKGFLISTKVLDELMQELCSLFEVEPQLSVAAIRDRWQVTRKHAIPLLEYCDRQAITVRRGDVRVAGRKLPSSCPSRSPSEPAVG